MFKNTNLFSLRALFYAVGPTFSAIALKIKTVDQKPLKNPNVE